MSSLRSLFFYDPFDSLLEPDSMLLVSYSAGATTVTSYATGESFPDGARKESMQMTFRERACEVWRSGRLMMRANGVRKCDVVAREAAELCSC